MRKITFITLAVPGKSALKALMMANSLRSFGGHLKSSPIWVLVPEGMNRFSNAVQDHFKRLKVATIPFKIEPNEQKFPFASKIAAASHAEEIAKKESELLVWLDCDNIILKEPDEFLLPSGVTLGYRPVHHKLIGPSWGEPLDPFWNLIYQSCAVPGDRQFQMTTHAGEKTRPYFNAGTFVIRPERHLMAQWRNAFLKSFNQPEFQTLYQKDDRYIIFMHQAVFTGVLLHDLKPVEMWELSLNINYPLHLHREIPVDLRPGDLAELTTLRYENIFDSPGWQGNLPIPEPLRSWLEAQPLLQNASGATV
jgi:hypothetical protein